MEKLINKNLFLKILVFFILSSCALKEIKEEAPHVNKIYVDQRYRINLPEDHSSGYIWRLNDDYDRTILENINAVWHGNTKGIDFNFNTLTIGQTTLTFVSRKYNDTSDIKQFIVQIIGK